MEIIRVKNYQELSDLAASEIIEIIQQKSNAVLALPTGRTPLGTYQNLVKNYKAGLVSFKKVIIFNLDEYIGLPPSHPKSYAFFMKKHLFSQINIDPKRTFIPNGLAKDLDKECLEYERKIEKYGPIDPCVLGIGRNGHIAFNEPGTDPNLATHIANLAPETIKVNKGPETAVTMGIKTILKAKKILFLAVGKEKAEAVFKMIKGPISTACPASFLQTHKNVKVILDKEAASRLSVA